MKKFIKCLILLLTLSSQIVLSQPNDPFLESYSVRKKNYPEKAKEYKDIAGSPYLNSEFVDGSFYLKDTVVIKLPMRYNIYADEMEYKFNGVNYAVGNPLALNKIVIGDSKYLYLPHLQKGGYYELLEFGKCTLIQKKVVEIKPAEGPKPMQPDVVPATFVRKSDVNYFLVNDSNLYRLDNLRAVKNALQDHKTQIDEFLKYENIKRINQENLIKIAKFYNSL